MNIAACEAVLQFARPDFGQDNLACDRRHFRAGYVGAAGMGFEILNKGEAGQNGCFADIGHAAISKVVD
jgi:hypothetical protein